MLRLSPKALWFIVLLLAGPVAVQASARLEDEQNTIEITRTYSPSVVTVHITLGGERLSPFHDEDGQGGGSGFLVNDAPGQIVTNYHVVEAAFQPNSITLRPGAEITISFAGSPDVAEPVRAVGANLDYDLVLLEPADGGIPQGLKPIPLGDSNNLEVGQKVIAIGNPFGLQSTVTTGIVSAVEREAPSAFGINVPYIQTDAAINPGNSGGPLLDSSGRAVGINNAILSPSGAFAGVSFALPSQLLSEVLPQLRAGGMSGVVAAFNDPAQPRLGIASDISVGEYPPELRKELGLPDHGAVVTAVLKGGPADRAGLLGPKEAVSIQETIHPVGADIIIAVDGEPVDGIHSIQRQLLGRKAGDRVELQVWRGGRLLNIPVRISRISE
jgi:serine protease Do